MHSTAKVKKAARYDSRVTHGSKKLADELWETAMSISKSSTGGLLARAPFIFQVGGMRSCHD